MFDVDVGVVGVDVSVLLFFIVILLLLLLLFDRHHIFLVPF